MSARALMLRTFGVGLRHERLALLNLIMARALQQAVAEEGHAVTIYRNGWSGSYDVTDEPCPPLSAAPPFEISISFEDETEDCPL